MNGWRAFDGSARFTRLLTRAEFLQGKECVTTAWDPEHERWTQDSAASKEGRPTVREWYLAAKKRNTGELFDVSMLPLGWY